MINIPIVFNEMPLDFDRVNTFFKSIITSNSTMVFLSQSCYEHIKENLAFVENTDIGNSSKVFINYTVNKDNLYLSIIPLYTGGLFYLEKILLGKTVHMYNAELPNKIIFITLEGEEKHQEPNTLVLDPPLYECPVNCIMDNFGKVDNALFIIVNRAYQRLIKNTNLISGYKNNYNLIWNADHNYAGGTISLQSFDNGCNYLIKDMSFERFSKKFSLNGIPNNIYFII